MKTKTLSNITVGIKADGKAKIELHDIQNVEEDSLCSKLSTEDSLAYRYRILEESQVIGKYVRDFDPMLRGVSLIL